MACVLWNGIAIDGSPNDMAYELRIATDDQLLRLAAAVMCVLHERTNKIDRINEQIAELQAVFGAKLVDK